MEQVRKIHKEAANESASWGIFRPKLFLILPSFVPLYEKCFVFLSPNCVNVQRNECIRTK
ncbi:hypothetical protein L0M93_09205 [Bacteroides cellulosilyticus]|nr:hypothetical protein [Bacteroides cellulosilyticus]